MHADALAVLELDRILARLAQATETPRGTELALALAPSPDPNEVAARQTLTAEAVTLLEHADEPSLAGSGDVREAAALAARGGALTPADLRAIARSIAVALEARRALADVGADAPCLAATLAPLDPGLAAIARAVDGSVEEDGSDLRDNASPALRRLRTDLRRARERIGAELERLAHLEANADALQERFVTERAGRPVLAVKASARGRLPGIVHGTSGSGQTLFVEPFAVAELGNRLAEVVGAEREEVDRILRELSAPVGERAAELEALVEAVAAVDLALACGTLSRRWRGAPVTVAAEVRLLGARHPLLDPDTAVPIDLDLGDLRALVVSGPNTGGKTVALKTLGLAALLHQCGLRPPADTAQLPVFDDVLADIGDRQSIEMSLSTFSGHLRTVVAILDAATDRTLVLLDEVAAGTDPVEGSALAQALVARLARQARLTMVTTHYAELKEWASATPGAANAATGFDADTDEPLYRIALGRPGTSHALRVAERLGLDADVAADARARVAPERLRITDLLAEAEAAERAASEDRERAAAELAQAERAEQDVRERETQLAAELERVRAGAERERERAAAAAHEELATARVELAALRDEIRAARRSEGTRTRALSRVAQDAEAERDRRLGAASTRVEGVERELDATAPLRALSPLAAGDPVEAPDLGVRGTIAAVRGGEAEVIGASGLRVRIPLDRLHPSAQRPDERRDEPPVRVLAATRADVPDELDVRGMRAQEAREAVRSFVDEAALAGLDNARVIHGRGTGAVRTAVREELRSHRLVDRIEPEAHDGATLAHLG